MHLTNAFCLYQVETKRTALPLGENNVCVVSLCVAGTSLCLVGVYLHIPSDFPGAIGSLSAGRRGGFDLSSQCEHFFAGGYLTAKEASKMGEDRAVWKDLGHGFGSRILPSQHFALRSSFPGLLRDDKLNPKDRLASGHTPVVLLVDEIIMGKPAPYMPNSAYATK